jgi:hypothetical protein
MLSMQLKQLKQLQLMTNSGKCMIICFDHQKVLDATHHIIPKSGWVSHEIQNTKDAKAVIDVFGFQYRCIVELK